MSSERNVDVFAALILVLSIIGIILLSAFSFAGFYYPGYGNRYSCFDCGYTTEIGLSAQIIVLVLLIVQIVIVLNDLLPKKFIEKDLEKHGMVLAIITILFVIIGIGSFGIQYSEYEWWPETGFYGAIIAGLLNTILFFLKDRNK